MNTIVKSVNLNYTLLAVASYFKCCIINFGSRVADKRGAQPVLRAWLKRLTTRLGQLRETLDPVHDDDGFKQAWDQASPEDHERAKETLLRMEARTTASINNTYLKAQITTGVMIALIVLYLTIGQQKDVNINLLAAGVVMTAAGIVLTLLIPTPRGRNWQQKVHSPGVYALTQTREEEVRSLSRRVLKIRVTLLRSRRIAWSATWLFMLPGFVLAMMSWLFVPTCIMLVGIVPLRFAYRRLTRSVRPAPPNIYPAP